MRGTTHVIGALALALAAGEAGLLAPTPSVLAAAALGGLLPDIDHPGSVLGRRVLPIALLAQLLGGHRGPTHSIAVAFAAGALALALGLPATVAAALMLGYASHLALDYFNPTGVPLAWPLRARRYAAPATIRTGGAVEMAFAIPLALMTWLLFPR